MRLWVTVVTSIALYSGLALTSLWHLIPLCRGRSLSLGFSNAIFSRSNSVDDTHVNLFDHVPLKFQQGAKVFYCLLFISACLDLPFVVGCFVHHAPNECRWDNSWYFLTYSMHLVALIGYFICMGVPLKLWSDTVSGAEEDLFSFTCSKSFPVIFISTVVFCVLVIIEILSLVVAGPYGYNRATEAVRGIEAFEYVFVAMYWTVKGLNLVYHLRGIMSRDSNQAKVLLRATIVMLIICISYLFRAGLIMATIFGANQFFRDHYAIWLIGTRWLPYIISSFLLIFVMRLSLKSLSAQYSALLPNSAFSSVSERRDSFAFGPEFSDHNFEAAGRQTNYFDDSGSNFSLYWLGLLNKPPKDRVSGDSSQNDGMIQ
jgi:uncharacterized membrane protein YozB (DUF420 family)